MCNFAFQNQNKGETIWWLPLVPLAPLFWELADEFDKARERERKKKRKKKEQKRAEAEQRQVEAERQKQIALQRQAEEENQRRIKLAREAEAKMRAEEEKQKIRDIAASFANQSLCELTHQKLVRAKNLKELPTIYEEASCVRNIELYTNGLSNHYYEAIMHKLYNTYSKSNALRNCKQSWKM